MSIRRLVLVRHGLPDYSFGLEGDEPPGPPLSATGTEQVRQAIPVVRRLGPVAVYSSPLARARQSAVVVAQALGLPVRIDSELKEWHRTESLYQVTERSARWLGRWLHGSEPCAALFGHGTPLLSIIRTALFLPHFKWWLGNSRQRLALDAWDRFELSMGSVFEIVFTPQTVTARCLHHPEPRILHFTRRGGIVGRPPWPAMAAENREICRPNFGRLIGYSGSRARKPRSG